MEGVGFVIIGVTLAIVAIVTTLANLLDKFIQRTVVNQVVSQYTPI